MNILPGMYRNIQPLPVRIACFRLPGFYKERLAGCFDFSKAFFFGTALLPNTPDMTDVGAWQPP
jgi:hypothetical protein